MKNVRAYIRKNIVFVSLLSTLLCITIFFGGYLLMNQPKKPSEPSPTPPPPVEEQTPEITSLEGNYDKDAQVTLHWSINRGDETIKSVRLYQGERQLGGDMNGLTSYSFAQNLYQFPTGDVKFRLQVNFENGEELSKEVTIFIVHVLNIQMTSENVEDGVLLKLSYQYDAANPVAIPRIKTLNDVYKQPFEFIYQDTIRETSGSLESATTTYKIGTTKVAEGEYKYTIRWIFDGLNTSKDFPIKITK